MRNWVVCCILLLLGKSQILFFSFQNNTIVGISILFCRGVLHSSLISCSLWKMPQERILPNDRPTCLCLLSDNILGSLKPNSFGNTQTLTFVSLCLWDCQKFCWFLRLFAVAPCPDSLFLAPCQELASSTREKASAEYILSVLQLSSLQDLGHSHPNCLENSDAFIQMFLLFYLAFLVLLDEGIDLLQVF